MASLSERLRRERELRGISLRQISEETRIGVRFLEALEENKLEIIPGEFYRRSYLRAYARYLGLDEDRALNAYDFSRKDKSPIEEPEARPSPKSPAPKRPWPNWVKWVFATFGIGVPALVLLKAMPAATPDAAAPTAVPAESEISRRNASDPPAAAAEIVLSPFPAESSPNSGSLRLVLSVEEPCWLEIEADGEVVASGLKDEGFRQVVAARHEVRMWLGNAGGVKLLVNDRPARSLGRQGQVRKDLTITPDNYRDFLPSKDPS